MERTDAETTYYLISDLHMGGDAGLNDVDFERELIGFLRGIEEGPLPAELIIAGDMFGFWELPGVGAPDQLDWVVATHRELFDQFRETGRTVAITVLAGNHDYDLICVPAYARRLAGFNIRLEPSLYVTRTVAGKTVWIEHGNLHDPFSRYSRFRDRHAVPAGYFVTSQVSAAAARSAPLGRSPWLKDLRSVYPNEDIPSWVVSNYFYREMSRYLRWLLTPFLVLFGVSIVAVLGGVLEEAGVISTRIFTTPLSEYIGFPGRIVDLVLWVDNVVVVFLLVLLVPGLFLMRDLRRTLERYGVDTSGRLALQKDDGYLSAAKRVFAARPDVALYVYGHTHIPSLRTVDGRCVVNTGTWLKRLERVSPWLRFLPPVYVPSFLLNYYRIRREGDAIRVEYEVVPKEHRSDLTFAQRLFTAGRRPRRGAPVPPVTLV